MTYLYRLALIAITAAYFYGYCERNKWQDGLGAAGLMSLMILALWGLSNLLR